MMMSRVLWFIRPRTRPATRSGERAVNVQPCYLCVRTGEVTERPGASRRAYPEAAWPIAILENMTKPLEPRARFRERSSHCGASEAMCDFCGIDALR